jgi:hypothetical protein
MIRCSLHFAFRKQKTHLPSSGGGPCRLFYGFGQQSRIAPPSGRAHAQQHTHIAMLLLDAWFVLLPVLFTVKFLVTVRDTRVRLPMWWSIS